MLAKKVGTGRDDSNPVLTARHLVTDAEAASEEPRFFFFLLQKVAAKFLN